MGFPDEKVSHVGRLIDNVAKLLNATHSGRYMVWNLSEKSYDYSKFGNQVRVLQQASTSQLIISRVLLEGHRLPLCRLSGAAARQSLYDLQLDSRLAER
jgi:hypothetical protein